MDQIVLLARRQGEVANQDVQELLGVRSAQASNLLRKGVADGRLELAPGSNAVGLGARYAAR